MTFAGPLTHIPQAAIWWVISWIMDTSDTSPHSPTYDDSDFGGSLVGTAFWVRAPPDPPAHTTRHVVRCVACLFAAVNGGVQIATFVLALVYRLLFYGLDLTLGHLGFHVCE